MLLIRIFGIRDKTNIRVTKCFVLCVFGPRDIFLVPFQFFLSCVFFVPLPNPGSRNLVCPSAPSATKFTVFASGTVLDPTSTSIDSEMPETHRLTDADGTERVASSGVWNIVRPRFGGGSLRQSFHETGH